MKIYQVEQNVLKVEINSDKISSINEAYLCNDDINFFIPNIQSEYHVRISQTIADNFIKLDEKCLFYVDEDEIVVKIDGNYISNFNDLDESIQEKSYYVNDDYINKSISREMNLYDIKRNKKDFVVFFTLSLFKNCYYRSLFKNLNEHIYFHLEFQDHTGDYCTSWRTYIYYHVNTEIKDFFVFYFNYSVKGGVIEKCEIDKNYKPINSKSKKKLQEPKKTGRKYNEIENKVLKIVKEENDLDILSSVINNFEFKSNFIGSDNNNLDNISDNQFKVIENYADFDDANSNDSNIDYTIKEHSNLHDPNMEKLNIEIENEKIKKFNEKHPFD